MLNLLKQKTIKPYNYTGLYETINDNILVNNDNESVNNANSFLSPAPIGREKREETKHNLPASKEWLNSIYTYNKNNAKLFSSTDKLVNRLIKSYFNLSILKTKKKSSRVQIRFKRLSLNRILVSKAEVKHANNKVIVNVYVYNRNKKFLLLKYKTISKKLLNTSAGGVKNLNKKTLKRRTKKRIIRMSLLNYYNSKISKINKTCLVSPFLSVQHTKKGKTAISCLLSLQGQNKKQTYVNQNVIKKKKWFFYKLINFCNTFPVSESLNNNIFKPNYKEFSLSAGVCLSNPIRNSEKEENTKKVSRKNNSYFMKNKIRLITVKSLGVLKKARSHRRLILRSLRWNNESFKRYEIKCYKNYLSKLYVKEMLCLYYMQLLLLNSNKLKSWFSLGIKSLLSRIYKKKIELNFINLKYLHLNNDNFIESINTKLKNRNNRLLRVLRKAIKLVKIPSSKLHYSKYIDSVQKRETKGFKLNISDMEKFVMDTLKYKVVNGVRVEAAGRLSKRLTASRSVFKMKYKGSIKNIDSSYKKISSTMLRGYTKPNVQQTSISSKTRNGSFGLKGWISSY